MKYKNDKRLAEFLLDSLENVFRKNDMVCSDSKTAFYELRKMIRGDKKC